MRKQWLEYLREWVPDLHLEAVESLKHQERKRNKQITKLNLEVERLRGLCDNLTDSLNGCNENNQAFAKRFREDQDRFTRLVERLKQITPMATHEAFGEFQQGSANGWNQCRAQVIAAINETQGRPAIEEKCDE